jgi:hypothetical protein
MPPLSPPQCYTTITSRIEPTKPIPNQDLIRPESRAAGLKYMTAAPTWTIIRPLI